MPTTSARFNHSLDTFGEWVSSVAVFAKKAARRAGRSMAEADDIAQEVAEYALVRGRTLMSDYADPRTFAAVRTYHASVAWDRRNGVQSGAGAAFARAKTSLDAEFGEGSSLRDMLTLDYDVAHEVERHHFDDAVRLMVATTLDPRSAKWLWDVKGHGMTVSDVARRDGVSREKVSRTVNQALRDLLPVMGQFLGG